MSATTPAPKTMSSRLLTMKFMQRAAASTPTHPSPATLDQPSPKRRKIEKEDGMATPKFNVDSLADQKAIQAAIANEEAKRLAALERQADESGDTRWVLTFEEQERVAAGVRGGQPLRVVELGWGGIDSSGGGYEEDEEEEEDEDEENAPVVVGRRSFGKFNVVEKKEEDDSDSDAAEDDEDDEDDEDEDEDEDFEEDSDDPTSQLIKSERGAAASRLKADRVAARRAERKEKRDMVRKRIKKEVNLNGLSSLSGRQDTRPAMVCYGCGGPHKRSECPNEGQREKKRRYDGDHNGGRQKTQRSR